MSRRNLGVVVGALVAVVVVLAVVLGSGTGGAQTGSPRPGESGAAVDIDAAACALDPTAPAASPADPSPSRAAFDDAGTMVLAEDVSGEDPNRAPGRLRLCVDGADPIEFGVGCTWTADRSSVEQFAGYVDLPAGGQSFVELTLSNGQIADLVIGPPVPGDRVGRYRAIGPASIGLDAGPGAVTGAVGFAGVPFDRTSDAGAIPANQRRVIAGSFRWACGPAPAVLAGVATGRMTIRLDRPAGQQVEVHATCHWTVGVLGPAVASVETTSASIGAGAGKTWGLSIGQLGEPPLATTPEVMVHLSTPDGGDSYVGQEFGAVIVAEIAPASRQGRLRFHGLTLLPETGLPTFDGTEATRTLSGIVSWSCDQPKGGPEPVPGGAPPIVRPPTRPGTVTLDLEAVLDQALVIPVSCTFHNDLGDGGAIRFDGVEGQFPVGEETVRLAISEGSVVLFRTAPDGRILGEYTVDGDGPYLGAADEVPPTQDLTLVFRPTDPDYVPFGGDAGPRLVAATILIDCRDPNAPPANPDEAVGEISIHLDGIAGADWSGRATCRWALVDGRPVVVSVAGDPTWPISAGDQQLNIVGLPDAKLIVLNGNFGIATYRRLAGSTVQSKHLADDHSSGETAFANLSHGRLGNAHLRLGGISGPETISGTLDWSCGPPSGGPGALPSG